MRRPRRLTRAAIVVAALCLWAGTTTSAHRLDEYLQATRVAINRDRVDLEIDLTPGVAVADQVLERIDADRDGRISNDEASAYSRQVLNDLSIEVDGRPQRLTLTEVRCAPVAELRQGIGAIRIKATAPAPAATAGPHVVFTRNVHRPDISVYLANALVPANADLTIQRQVRDPQQHELRIEFDVARVPHADVLGWLAPLGAATALTALGWQWRRRRGRPSFA